MVSLQNSVARAQIGTVTGAMNFFRALMSSFTVAAFTAILLMALGADISLAGEHRGPVNSIPAADMITAFRYVFGAATALLACAALCIILDGGTAAGRPRRRRRRWRSNGIPLSAPSSTLHGVVLRVL